MSANSTYENIYEILDAISVDKTAWDCGEDVVVVNGCPVGMTMKKGVPVASIWSYIKGKIAEEIVAGLNK